MSAKACTSEGLRDWGSEMINALLCYITITSSKPLVTTFLSSFPSFPPFFSRKYTLPKIPPSPFYPSFLLFLHFSYPSFSLLLFSSSLFSSPFPSPFILLFPSLLFLTPPTPLYSSYSPFHHYLFLYAGATGWDRSARLGGWYYIITASSPP